MEPIFKSFDKIEQYKKLYMSITQKIHGTNAQIYIWKDDDGLHHIHAGSRTRWLSPDDDNYGFANFVYQNADDLIKTLGVGRHYGEWCGKGINAGEGLDHKQFVLFDWKRWTRLYSIRQYIIPNVCIVPVLYAGRFDMREIDEIFDSLKTNGSRLVPGYMKPEGIVIEVGDKLYKKVFDNESVAWKRPEITSKEYHQIDVSKYLQPLRLQKLIVRDERFIREYPKTLPDIARLYIADLIDEKELDANDETTRRAIAKQLYHFIKEYINEEIAKFPGMYL